MKSESFALESIQTTVCVPPSVSGDSIFLKGLRVNALIGAYAHERHAPQPLLIDLELGLSSSNACYTDRLQDAVDYGAVIDAVRRVAATNTSELLERFSQRVADTLLNEFSLHSVNINVTKPCIFFDSADAIGVSIRRFAQFS